AEPGTDWAGRLLCINDFAIAAARRFENTLLVKAEECPLCFKAFGDVCVWWTCGHCMCGDCNPKVLRAEKQWGHSQNPRCPLCRERSDIGDIVKVLLESS
ncbi:zinc finger protein, putative, partial [Bodo saltans]